MPLDIHQLRQEDWRSEFGAGDLRRGIGYAEEKRSKLLSIKDNSLLANCRGSGGQTYQQRITLHPYGRKWCRYRLRRPQCALPFTRHITSKWSTWRTDVDYVRLNVPKQCHSKRLCAQNSPSSLCKNGDRKF